MNKRDTMIITHTFGHEHLDKTQTYLTVAQWREADTCVCKPDWFGVDCSLNTRAAWRYLPFEAKPARNWWNEAMAQRFEKALSATQQPRECNGREQLDALQQEPAATHRTLLDEARRLARIAPRGQPRRLYAHRWRLRRAERLHLRGKVAPRRHHARGRVPGIGDHGAPGGRPARRRLVVVEIRGRGPRRDCYFYGEK